jgi:UDP-glucuronate 4-epimerase
MKVLITGAAGFIGSHLADRLLADGDEVVGIDDFNDYYDPAIKRRNVSGALDHAGYRLVEGDIRDASLVDELFAHEGFEVVVHLAARAGVRRSLEEPLLYTSVNLDGTMLLLEACRRNRVRRFVFASSSSVYGDDCTPPFREGEAADHPIAPYPATKRAGELLVHSHHHLYGIEAPCLRFFTVYGPRQRPDMAIHKFTRLIDRGEPLPFYGDGTTYRDYTYIDDIIQGVVAAVRVPGLGFAPINLGENQTISLAELVAEIEAALGKEAILDRQPMAPGDMLRTCADLTRARELLDYQPTTSIREGLPRWIEWYRQTYGDA